MPASSGVSASRRAVCVDELHRAEGLTVAERGCGGSTVVTAPDFPHAHAARVVMVRMAPRWCARVEEGPHNDGGWSWLDVEVVVGRRWGLRWEFGWRGSAATVVDNRKKAH